MHLELARCGLNCPQLQKPVAVPVQCSAVTNLALAQYTNRTFILFVIYYFLAFYSPLLALRFRGREFPSFFFLCSWVKFENILHKSKLHKTVGG